MDLICGNSLVLFLPLHEMDGSSFMSRDACGHLCTVTGALWKANSSYFDGVDDKVNCGHSSALNLTTGATVEVWFKPVAVSADNWAGLYWKGGDWGHKGYHMVQLRSVDGSKIRWNIRSEDDSSNPVLSTIGCTVGSWWHVVGTYDGTTSRLFINGSETGTPTTPANIGSNPAQDAIIAKAAAGAYQNSYIGEVRVYNRGLSAVEILHNYNVTKWRYQ